MQSHGGPQLVAELPQSLKNATASKYFGLSIQHVCFTLKSGHAHHRQVFAYVLITERVGK